MSNQSSMNRDRQILAAAHEKGSVATVFSYFRLSGPGWLQSAITLGGGSLTSALFLGVLGGYQMLWLQWIAIVLGVIMLSAISYVTLSSRLRPFDAINQHVNPILGCGWLLATLMANIIWCMPQFSLCYDALEKGLLPAAQEKTASAPKLIPANQLAAVSLKVQDPANSESKDAEPTQDAEPAQAADQNETNDDVTVAGSSEPGWQFADGTLSVNSSVLGNLKVDQAIQKAIVSVVLLTFAFCMVAMSAAGGWAAWWFDVLLKVIIGVIVLCFFGTVIYLSREGRLPWNEILQGFIPNFSHWYSPSKELAALLQQLPEESAARWSIDIVSQQKDVMISTVATAVGINMTFLLPYSLLARGWDRTFRGLARFDLFFGMLIPFILVTTCVVITSAAAFHAKADPGFLSSDPAMVASSPLLRANGVKAMVERHHASELGEGFADLDTVAQDTKLADVLSKLTEAERLVMVSLVKRNSFELSQTLAPLFAPSSTDGTDNSNAVVVAGLTAKQLSSLVFSVGALAMGFSTIIVLMLINGYVFAELFQSKPGSWPFLIGAAIAGIAGASWPFIWQGDSKLWLAISASTFGFLLLPIAYFAFWLLMNNKAVLGEDRPEGVSRILWNVMLLTALITTLVAAAAALWDKLEKDPTRGQLVLGAVACFIVLAAVGFFAANRKTAAVDYDLE